MKGVVSGLIVDLSMQPITPENSLGEISTLGVKRITEGCGGAGGWEVGGGR